MEATLTEATAALATALKACPDWNPAVNFECPGSKRWTLDVDDSKALDECAGIYSTRFSVEAHIQQIAASPTKNDCDRHAEALKCIQDLACCIRTAPCVSSMPRLTTRRVCRDGHTWLVAKLYPETRHRWAC